LAKRFEELEVWQTARKLTREVYELSNRGPFAKDYGLRDQMRRAAVSIMSNIAEGFESRTDGLFLEFLGRAKGSARELRAQAVKLRDECEKCSSQISRFMAHLKAHPRTGVDAGEPKRREQSA
jgi:four helix bundle protein